MTLPHNSDGRIASISPIGPDLVAPSAADVLWQRRVWLAVGEAFQQLRSALGPRGSINLRECVNVVSFRCRADVDDETLARCSRAVVSEAISIARRKQP
jgi:hypothetical protein